MYSLGIVMLTAEFSFMNSFILVIIFTAIIIWLCGIVWVTDQEISTYPDFVGFAIV